MSWVAPVFCLCIIFALIPMYRRNAFEKRFDFIIASLAALSALATVPVIKEGMRSRAESAEPHPTIADTLPGQICATSRLPWRDHTGQAWIDGNAPCGSYGNGRFVLVVRAKNGFSVNLTMFANEAKAGHEKPPVEQGARLVRVARVIER